MTKGETLGQRIRRRNTRRVLLVDDHPVVRDGYSMTLGAQPDLEVCAEAANADEAMAAVADSAPDIVLLDLSLKGVGGMELISMIHAEHPSLPILIVSMHDEATHAVPALRAGARGYVMKQESTDTVIAATRAVLEGKTWVSEDVKAGVLDMLAGDKTTGDAPPDVLTPRELEVFELMGLGQSLRQISKRLRISLRTAETHRNRIRVKLAADSAVDLQHQAFLWMNRLPKE